MERRLRHPVEHQHVSQPAQGRRDQKDRQLRDRMRSLPRNVMRIGRVARIKGERGKKAVAAIYRKARAATGRVKQAALEGMQRHIDVRMERTGFGSLVVELGGEPGRERSARCGSGNMRPAQTGSG